MTFFHLVNEPNGYLSNWYKSDFVLDGNSFCCVEQYLMWYKALMFHDTVTASNILKENDPVRIKQLGRSVKDYIDSRWASVRYEVVKVALFAKFTQNAELLKELLSTDGSFAECAANDLIWSIGIGMRDPKRFDPSRWRGQNLLGFALQEVYNDLSR